MMMRLRCMFLPCLNKYKIDVAKLIADAARLSSLNDRIWNLRKRSWSYHSAAKALSLFQ